MADPEKSDTRKGCKEKTYDFLKNFTENTSFHGVRYTFEAGTFLGRTLWLLVVIAFAIWFTYQVGERAAYYQKNPVTVDMNVAFNNSLRFPSVAICNTNQFRMTKAREAGIYRKLQEFYGADLNARRNITLADDLNITQTMLDMAHRKEDMIKKCVWKGHNCSHVNFTQMMTDFGVCFVFNDLHANKSVRDPKDFEVQNTGASFGLELYLNAEVYELSPGPHLSSGIQVLIFNGHDHPRVSDLGTAVPVFGASRAALHISSVTRLPKPHGDCASQSLRDYNAYSFQACLAEVKTNATAEICGCIEYGQRWVGPDKPPYCNLSTLYGCCSDVSARTFAHTCTHPCYQDEFTTTLSNTDLSATSIFSILDILESDKTLLERYKKALLLRQLVDKRTVKDDLNLLGKLHQASNYLHESVQKPLRNNMSTIDVAVKAVQRELRNLNFHLQFYIKLLTKNYNIVFRVQTIENYLEPQLVKLEIRTWNLQRTILPAKLKIVFFKMDGNSRKAVASLQGLLAIYFQESINLIYSVDKMYNTEVRGLLAAGGSIVDGLPVPRGIIRQKNREIFFALFEFSTRGIDLRKKMSAFQTLARTLTTVSKSEEQDLYSKLEKQTNDIRRSLTNFRTAVTGLRDAMNTVSVALAGSISTLKARDEKLAYFLHEVGTNIANYERAMKAYSVDSVEKFFTDVEKRAFDLIPIWQTITKERLIELVTPASKFRYKITSYVRGSVVLIDILRKIDGTKSDLKSIQQTYDAVIAVRTDVPVLAKMIDTQGKTLLPRLRSLDKTIGALYYLIPKVQKATDDFLQELDTFLNDLVKFNKTLTIDHTMVRQNILALQVFYQSLSLTEVIKSPAYTWFSLLCDIGGTAGLFLGGSFLTILEIFYFIGRNIKTNHAAANTKANRILSTMSAMDTEQPYSTGYSEEDKGRRYSAIFSITSKVSGYTDLEKTSHA
ncbi:uncharacterized protein LOC135495153 isoform X1 [Lineus longissimus]|uniref:uncharacterized protein LOC135495153 isoform X1 n=1 Tax=Lineus longissimus TaxID=88925 RepID=UPI00315CDFCA